MVQRGVWLNVQLALISILQHVKPAALPVRPALLLLKIASSVQTDCIAQTEFVFQHALPTQSLKMSITLKPV